MISLPSYKNKKVAVFGLGKSGIAAVRALCESGASVVVWDDNETARNNLAAENIRGLELKDFNNYVWHEIEALVLSPGIPLTHPKPHPIVEAATQADCPIICDIELLIASVPEAKFIGITGTNGKSTTTALIGHILKHASIKTAVGGNIGISVLELETLEEGGIYVLELSSFQLGLIKHAQFDIAVLLNITPDHLDRHGDMGGYIKAKKRIFMNQDEDSITIIGVDDGYCREIYEKLDQGTKVAISNSTRIEEGISVINGIISDGMNNIELGQLENLVGAHNDQNIAAAYAVSKVVGVGTEKIIEAIKTFPGLPHRTEKVAEIEGVTFINDSKATNAEATEKAILCFDNIYWIAGGIPKSGGIKPLEKYFQKIKHAFLIGKSEDEFAEILEGRVTYTKCGNLETAVKKAAELAFSEVRSQPKSNLCTRPTVLFSPACASFDQFRNFEERGKCFKKYIFKNVTDHN